MIKSAIEYVLGLKRPEVVEVDGQKFSTVNLDRIPSEAKVAAIQIRSLSGVVDYIQSHFDSNRKLMIQVESPTKVNVFDALDNTNDRRYYVQSKALLPDITFERFVSREQFQIMLQSCFVMNEDKATVLKIISSIVEENGVQTTDDGMSQRVTAKTGVATVGFEMIPNPVRLKPFRTFVEISQPDSEFILRLKEGGQVGLFEADGGAWELNAMALIAEYFKAQLSEEIAAGAVYIIN